MPDLQLTTIHKEFTEWPRNISAVHQSFHFRALYRRGMSSKQVPAPRLIKPIGIFSFLRRHVIRSMFFDIVGRNELDAIRPL